MTISMTPTELWWLALAIFSVVVIVVTVLLGLVIAATKSIDRRLHEIWLTGREIAGNTVSIWLLERTNRELAGLAEAARTLERRVISIEESRGTAEPRVGREP